jgi:hypothetical protein
MKLHILTLLAILSITISNKVNAQTGPGGVGSSTTNPLWMQASKLSGNTGDAISSWADASGNGNNFEQSTNTYQPTLQLQNNIKVVRFDGTDDFLEEESGFAGYTARTAIVVYRVDANLQQTTDLGQLWGYYQQGVHIAVDARSGNSQGFSFDGNSSDKAKYARNGGIYSNLVEDDNNDTWIYGNFEIVTAEFDSDRSLTKQMIGDLVTPSGHNFGGDIAEIIVYNTTLNDAQRIIVENYLSAKFGITITNDKYSYSNNYGYEVAGLGQISSSNQTSSWSGSVLKIEGASALSDDEFLLFGHDNNAVDSWTTTNTPFSGNNISRISRTWRLDETGDVGDINLTIDTSLFAARPTGYSKFVVMLDDDNDFTDATRIYELTSGGSDEFYSITGLAINDGDYITIATVKPVVQFSQATSSGFEDGTCSIEVSSNFTLQSSITVQVSSSDGTATAGSDYTAITNQDVTINAGSISQNVTVTINSTDGTTEDDEDFTLTLTSSDANVEIGAQNTHIYTIHDIDNTDKIAFSSSNPSFNEGDGSVNIAVTSGTTSAQVSYKVVGGTATNGASDDYVLADGTIDFSTGVSQNISITLNDDALPEENETIKIELYNPQSANLDNTVSYVNTITINDNDDANEIKVSFLSDSIPQSESVTSYDLQIVLSSASGYNITADYTVSGNAIYGTDHNLASGSISIPAGNTTATITLPIINDDIEESMDTVIITLSNVTNGSLGTKPTVNYYILNDDYGYTGPGGVGSSSAIKQWLRADKDVTYDGSNLVSQWDDFSGNGYNAVPGAGAGTEPLYVANTVNGFPAVEFAGGGVTGSNTASTWLKWEASGTGYQAQEMFIIFKPETGKMSTNCLGQLWGSYPDLMHVAADARSNSIERGFSFDGANASTGGEARYSLDGTVNFTPYSRGSNAQQWSFDTWHMVTADFKSVNTLEVNNIGHLVSGSNHHWFGGKIAEIIVYGSTVDTTDRIIIENYLAAKYGITIPTDYYAHQASYKYDLAGIGQMNSNNYHYAAQSAGILKISDASAMDDGDYFLFAHDNGDITAWNSTETPSSAYKRIAREWRFDQTGTAPGTVTVEVDLSNVATLPNNITQVVLLIDTDGDFTSGTSEYKLTNQGGNIYKADNITINDDAYVTIAAKIPTISFETSFTSESETNTAPTIKLVLSENAPVDVTVDYKLVAGGTATDGGTDFSFTDGTATISAGTSSTTISFTIVDDTESEASEYFYVNINSPTNAELGEFEDLTFYIQDNDGLEWNGPGGIGNLTDQVNVWYKTTEVTNLSDRDNISSGTEAWLNVTDNPNIDANQTVAAQQPTFYSTTVQWNDRPLINFDRAQREFLAIPNNSFMNTASNSAPQTQRSILVVFRPTNDVTNRQVIFEEGGGARGLNIYLENGKIYLGAWNNVDDAGSGTAWTYKSSNSTIEGNKPYFALLEFDVPDLASAEVRGTVNGNAFSPISGAGLLYRHGGAIGLGAMNSGTCFEGHVCKSGEDYYFDGYISEFVSSNVIYNDAQKIILYNYLNSKYGITLPSNDYFEYDINNAFSYELFGIGQVDNDNTHTSAQGTGIIKIETPIDLGDNEFLLIGHDTNDIDGWVQTNIPNADSNIYRIERTWRVDEHGDLGAITLKVDTSLFDTKPTGMTNYCLIIDSDGDFTSGSTIKMFTTKDVNDNNMYYLSGIDFTKGDFFTIGCIKPAVDFSVATAQSVEPDPDQTYTTTINLNVPLSYDVKIDYTFTDITAENGTTVNVHDYTGTNGTATITAGNTSTTVSFDILNDGIGESNETFKITLSNPDPTNIAIGYDTTYTYTIIDDDQTRKVNFGETTRNDDESIVKDTAFVVLNQAAPSGGVSVDYKVLSSSTATNGTVDFNLTESGTLNFAQGEDTVLLIFDINDDNLNETNETINIELSNAQGILNLGDDINFTYTINDNDSKPDVEFTTSSNSGMESYSPISVEVSLSSASGQDVVVSYSVNASSTASGSGIDYTLGTSSITIPAGDTKASFPINIVNDKAEDDNETIIIDIDGATNANVTGNTQYTYTIIDDDFGGWEGPGGIGNLDNQVGCWLRSTQVYNITNGVNIGLNGSTTMWEDQSHNNNNAYSLSDHGAPMYYDDDATWNKRPLLWYKASESDMLEIANNDEMNTPSGPQSKRTIIVAFRPTDDITSRQVIYEEGGGIRGLNIYIVDDTLNIGGYNVGNVGTEVQWKYIPIRFEIQPNTPYFAILQFDFENGSGDVRGALNGSDFSVLTGADLLYPHGDNIGIGGVNGGARGIGQVNLPSGSSYFNGYFAEFMSGNFVYNTAQLLILQNYMAAKYNINIGAKDIYAYDATHGWELFGIGQKSNDNSHNKAQGQGRILLSNPSDLDDNEFMLIGHDGEGIETWNSKDFIDIPNNDTNFVRVKQEWRIDMTGDVGTVNIDIDTSNVGNPGYFDIQDPDFSSFVIMIDADGDFTSSASIYQLKHDNVLGNEKYLVLTDYNFSSGDFFTIGLGNTGVGFANATAEAMEDAGSDQPIEIKLNMYCTNTVTVDYKTVDETTTSGSDYTGISGTLTFAPGEISKTIYLSLIDDVGAEEDDETLYIVLENPSNTLLTQDTLTFTIHDDDNSNKINFSTASASINEGDGTYTVTVTRSDNTGTSSVEYNVTGGTAINGASDDYVLANGSVSFADTEGSKTFDITINQDAIDEDNETIIINLTNPSSASLGTVTEFTLTINDDDTDPTIQFTNTTGQGSESFNPLYVDVELSAVSGKDISVNYSATDGTATNGGQDYNLVDGTLTIPAGETTGKIEIEIINDLVATADKDFTIDISAPTNATLGANTNYAYTILDDDDLGWEGPGGVGNSEQYAFWYRADAESYSDGNTVNPFTDQSGHGYNATLRSGTPIFKTNTLNGEPAVYFDGTDDMLEVPRNKVEIDNASYTVKTIAVAFRTDNDVSSRQVIYEQGGGRSGLSIYIYNNKIYFSAYDFNGSGWGFASVSTNIATSTTYYGLLVFDKSDETTNGTLKGYLNGSIVGTDNSINQSLTTSNQRYNGLGAMRYGMRFEDGSNINSGTDDYFFKGYIAECINYNFALNEAQRTIIENYFAGKYGATNSSTYTYSAINTHFHDITGIGQIGTDNHIKAKGTGRTTLSEPSNMTDGDFIMIGSNDAGITSWNTITGLYDGTAKFLDEVWKVGKKTPSGLTTIQLGIDVGTPVPAKPSDYPTYIIMIDPDNDGDGDPTTTQDDLIIYPLKNPDGNTLRIDDITLNDGYYIRVGVAKNRSVQSGEWYDVNTWLTGEIPSGSTETAYISSGQHVTLDVGAPSETPIGKIIVEAGCELTINQNIKIYESIVNDGDITLNESKKIYLENTSTITNNNNFTCKNSSYVFYRGDNQEIEGLDYYYLYVTGGTHTISDDLSCFNLLHYSTSTITAINSIKITIKKDWITDDNPVFNPAQSTVIFSGTSTQEINHPFTLYNVEIDNYGDYVYCSNGDITIKNNIKFTHGKVYLDHNIRIENTASDAIQGISSSSYFRCRTDGAGQLIRKVSNSTTFDFPVGDETNYTPLSITVNSGANSSDNIGVVVVDGKYSEIGDGSYITRYWTVTPTSNLASNPNYDISFTYTDNDIVGDEDELLPVKYDDSNGMLHGDLYSDINTSTNTFTWTGITSFSTFTGSNFEALPIKLLLFNGIATNNNIKLIWTTTTEINNDYFEIQHSKDAANFKTIGVVKGSGNSNINLNYNYIDNKPNIGTNYYRLKQVDYNGNIEYHKIIAINWNGIETNDKEDIKIYPNPYSNNNLLLDFKNITSNTLVYLTIMDINGNLILKNSIVIPENKEINIIPNMIDNLSQGVYIINIRTPSGDITKKIIIN